MKLSILIPTIESRRDTFENLYRFLEGQCFGKDVEILFERDNKEISIGKKRQILLERASGEYVTFADDDDWLSDDYVDLILSAIEFNPDCVGFQIECSGTEGKTADMSNKYADWADNVNGFDYVRTPYQKTPTKREIALQIGYKDMRYGEDYEYSKRLKESGLIKSEMYIGKVLYYYRFKYENPQTKFGM